MASRVVGYLAVCDPAAPSINGLADALLASRSAITQAVVLLESKGLAGWFRQRGERVHRAEGRIGAFTFEQELDSTIYIEQATLARARGRFTSRRHLGPQRSVGGVRADQRLPCREASPLEVGVAHPQRESTRVEGGGARQLILSSSRHNPVPNA